MLPSRRDDTSFPAETTNFSYGNAAWPDELTSVNGTSLTYDANGNVLTYGNMEFEWTNGRTLSQITVNPEDENGTADVYSYTYDESGIRSSKTVNGVTTYFTTKDGVILSQTDGTNTMYFQYDNSGAPVGFRLNGTQYFYLTNQMGDVIGIADSAGSLVATYTYGAWGETLDITPATANSSIQLSIANANPMRYRGYYLDQETGYYYLQSRYYDSSHERFINSDHFELSLVKTSRPQGYNLWCYCLNDSINSSDHSGTIIETVIDLASIGWSLADFLKQPSWYNLGFLAWDVGAACIPFAPGSYVAKGVVKGLKLGSKNGNKIAIKVATRAADLNKGNLNKANDSGMIIGKYKGLKKLCKGVKGVEVHHIIEKRFKKLFDVNPNHFAAIPLEPSLHQEITNRWRRQFGYGMNYKTITKSKMKKAIHKVYYDMGDLEKVALQWVDEHWKG